MRSYESDLSLCTSARCKSVIQEDGEGQIKVAVYKSLGTLVLVNWERGVTLWISFNIVRSALQLH